MAWHESLGKRIHHGNINLKKKAARFFWRYNSETYDGTVFVLWKNEGKKGGSYPAQVTVFAFGDV